MAEKIYPQGIMCFPPREGAPDFVKGKMIITLNEFVKWAKTQTEHMTEYKGEKQLKFDMLEGRNGDYFVLDTYKPTQQDNSFEPQKVDLFPEGNDDLPF